MENSCTGYLEHPFKNKQIETEKDLLSLELAKWVIRSKNALGEEEGPSFL